jgi:NADPH-dependent 2,4-dienoyl-CoA reductase/sulfur reductase-like enzyme
LANYVTARGNVKFKLNHEVVRIVDRNNKKAGEGKVVIEYQVPGTDGERRMETFDELVIACGQ